MEIFATLIQELGQTLPTSVCRLFISMMAIIMKIERNHDVTSGGRASRALSAQTRASSVEVSGFAVTRAATARLDHIEAATRASIRPDTQRLYAETLPQVTRPFTTIIGSALRERIGSMPSVCRQTNTKGTSAGIGATQTHAGGNARSISIANGRESVLGS
jgi:hypothetical protein